jgi:aquaporin Z
MTDAWKRHWPEYLIEAAGLGLFMVAAFAFGTILEHPGSAVRQLILNPLARRFLMGLAMGATAIAIIYSPWGKQSGAHINPSTTFTFYRLGKIARSDAFFYIMCQFTGGLVGAIIASNLFIFRLGGASLGQLCYHGARRIRRDHRIRRRAGDHFHSDDGCSACFESCPLAQINRPLCRRSGRCLYITLEAPPSGMSMNPARTLASAVPAQHWTALWIYFAAPILGMLSAAELYLRTNGPRSIACAKLHHDNP